MNGENFISHDLLILCSRIFPCVLLTLTPRLRQGTVLFGSVSVGTMVVYTAPTETRTSSSKLARAMSNVSTLQGLLKKSNIFLKK